MEKIAIAITLLWLCANQKHITAMSPSSVDNNFGRNEEEPPSRKDCQKAIKILTQYERLARKFGKHMGERRISELNRLRDTGLISINLLPGLLRSEFPLGTFDYMTLNDIRELCGM